MACAMTAADPMECGGDVHEEMDWREVEEEDEEMQWCAWGQIVPHVNWGDGPQRVMVMDHAILWKVREGVFTDLL